MGSDGSLHLGYLRKEIKQYLGQEVRSFHSMSFIVETKALMVEGSFLNIGSLVFVVHSNQLVVYRTQEVFDFLDPHYLDS